MKWKSGLEPCAMYVCGYDGLVLWTPGWKPMICPKCGQTGTLRLMEEKEKE